MNDDLAALVASMDNHSVTDAEGNLATEDTVSPQSEPTADIQKEQVVEAPAKAEHSSPQGEPEAEVVEDETTGKKFVPEERFKQVYGKMKEYERKLQTPEQPQRVTPREEITSILDKPSLVNVDRTEVLETELLYSTMPEFDPNSASYNPKLDKLGAKFWEPGKSKLQAAREAKAFMREISLEQDTVREQAKTVKIAQAEGGMVKRAPVRQQENADPDKMSIAEKETWLKAHGLW